MRGLGACILGFVVGANVPTATGQVPQVTMIGLGAGMTCAEWLGGGREDEAVEQWAFGFVSAFAATVQYRSGADPLARMDRESIHRWLAEYCAARPDATLSTVLLRMILSAVP